MTMEITAYTLGEGSGTGRTSIGLVPYEGIVAVDPRVIPYYTKLYIPGYGIAMAGDYPAALSAAIGWTCLCTTGTEPFNGDAVP